MFLFYEIVFMCLIVSWSPAVLAETIIKRTSAESTSYSLLTVNSSNFTDVKSNKIFTVYVREHNVSQRWKSMETTVIKLLAAFYNESPPIMSQITKDLNISSSCKRDLTKMLRGIKEFKYWAVQMLDSFGKIPIGIERGTFNALGDFDQCLDVDVPGHFQGQYCNLDLIMPLPKRQPFVPLDTEVQEIVQAVKSDGYFKAFAKFGSTLYFINPRVSICVPSTCSKDELQKMANKAVQTLSLPFGLQIPNCEILNKEVKFDSTEIVLMKILGILLLLATTASAVDISLKSMSNAEEHSYSYTSLFIKYLLCFSLYTNAKQLFKPEKGSLQFFNGIKVLTTLQIILYHSCLYVNVGAAGAFKNLYLSSQNMLSQLITNLYTPVETFFFISGVLHAITILRMKEEINIMKHILRRILRLTPAFMLVIACVILSPHLGSGPVWKETVGDLLADKCRARWWTNLLFINNFIPNDDMCLQWFWYIPANFHLYLLSFIALIPMKKNPALGLLINFLIMIGAMIVSAAFHVYYNLTPTLIMDFTHPEDISYFLDRGFFRTYLHCTSVCTGLAIGYFYVNRPKKLYIPWKVSAPLWIASLAGTLTCVLCAHHWRQGHLPSIGVSALYAIGRQVVYSLAMAWLIIACMTGNGGIVTKILSLPIFVPLGRLCYMVCLIHPLIHYMYIGSSRVTLRFDLRTIGYMYCGTVFISFICAIMLTLLFEAPFLALDKAIFAEKLREKTEQTKEIQRRKSYTESTNNEDKIKDTKTDKKVD